MALTGCSSDSSSNNSDSNSNSNTTKTIQAQTETGYFIDSAVAGLDYNTSSGISGTTDEFGRFKFKTEDRVTFSIGKLMLGEVKPQGKVVTPIDISEGNETATKVLQILQTLDSDDNTTNGITISDDVKKKISEGLKQEKKLQELKGKDNKLDDEEIIKILEPAKNDLDKNHDGKIDLVSEETAQAHFKNSLEEVAKGKLPDGTRAEDKDISRAKEEANQVKVQEENMHQNGSQNSNSTINENSSGNSNANNSHSNTGANGNANGEGDANLDNSQTSGNGSANGSTENNQTHSGNNTNLDNNQTH